MGTEDVDRPLDNIPGLLQRRRRAPVTIKGDDAVIGDLYRPLFVAAGIPGNSKYVRGYRNPTRSGARHEATAGTVSSPFVSAILVPCTPGPPAKTDAPGCDPATEHADCQLRPRYLQDVEDTLVYHAPNNSERLRVQRGPADPVGGFSGLLTHGMSTSGAEKRLP